MFDNLETAGITPVSVYTWGEIVAAQAPVIKPKKKYTAALYSCIFVIIVALSTMFTALYTQYENHQADIRRVEAITVLDNEYCGESLLGEVMPHDLDAEFTAALLGQYFQGLDSTEIYDENILYPNEKFSGYGELHERVASMQERYQYLGNTLQYCSRRLGDGPIGFTVYSDADALSDYNAACRYVYQILSELKINGSVTKKEAIIRINEWICNNRYYEMDPYKREWSTLHSVKGESGVCYNYTVLFQMLCLGCGIECEYVLSDNGAHCWNKVYSNDGSYWFVDVCWNDGSITGVNGDPIDENRTLAFNWFGSGHYDYLLETEKEFHASHREYFE